MKSEAGDKGVCSEAHQCREFIEKRYAEQRYVFSRDRCRNWTRHPSGYCHLHRAGH